MTKRSEKILCSAIKANGKPCQRWAVRGSDPPLCSAHGGRKQSSGSQDEGKNAFKHGFYSRLLSADELSDLMAFIDDPTLEDEIAIARVMLRRAMARLAENDMDEEELNDLAELVLSGTRTIGRLLRDQKELSNKSNEGLAAIGEALDKIAAEMGIEL